MAGTGGIPLLGPASAVRENILAAWRFKAVDTDGIEAPKKGSEAWVAKASQRDMEILTRALQRELNTRPTVANPIDVSSIIESDESCGPDAKHRKFNLSSDVASSSASMSCCSDTDNRPSRPGFEPPRSAAGKTSDSLGKCTDSYERTSDVGFSQPIKGKIGKKRPRGSNKSPVTILKADPANFREMVQRVTSVEVNHNMRGSNAIRQRASSGDGSIPVLRPQPKRPSRINYIPGLPTLDTSSCLNAMEFPGSYLDQLMNNGNDNKPRTMTRFGFDSPGGTDYFCHHEALKFPTSVPLDLSIRCSSNNNGDAGKFMPLRALNIGFTNQTAISAESDAGLLAAPENSLLHEELLKVAGSRS